MRGIASRARESVVPISVAGTVAIVAAAAWCMVLSPAAHAIEIGTLLDTCPQNDPAYSQIRADFEIRRNGVPVGSIPCSEPVSAMPVAQYTDELITLQALRTIYYMDMGTTHLPWTDLTLYDWMKSKLGGIDISDTASNSSCCSYYGNPPRAYFTFRAQDDSNRDFDRGWRGISGDIDLFAHETRHLDNFPHVSCCGTSNGCDQTYDEANLSPYGVQWWLNAHWLTGDLYVGFSCLSATEVQDAANWHLSACNTGFRTRFCTTLPPILTLPPTPGGECRARTRIEESVFNAGGHPVNGTTLASASYHVKLDAIGDSVEALGMTSAAYHMDASFVPTYRPPGESTGIRFIDKQTLQWSQEGSTGEYELYRGLLTSLPGTFGTCFKSAITTNSTSDPGVPFTGQGYFYLQTARNRLGEEGTKGYRSNGVERTNPSPCP